MPAASLVAVVIPRSAWRHAERREPVSIPLIRIRYIMEYIISIIGSDI